jgi:hypothetical protein
MSRGAETLAAATAEALCSRISNLRARLIAMMSVWGFYISTSWLSGGPRPAVNAWMHCSSSRGPTRGSKASNRS